MRHPGAAPHRQTPPRRAPSCEGLWLPRRGRRFADLKLFSQLPRHILSGSHVCRSQALLSWLPAPGPVPGWKQHPDGAIFSHFWGGGEEGLGKSCRDRGSEGVDLQGAWLARPHFCGMLPGTGGLSGETEAQSSPPGAVSWLAMESLTQCWCNRGDGVVEISLSVGSSCPDGDIGAAGRAQTLLSLIQRGRKSPSAPSALNRIHTKLSKPHHCVGG